MSLPSESTLRTLIGYRIKLSNEVLKFAISNSPNFVTMWETDVEALVADCAAAGQSALGLTRAQMAALLDPAVLRRDLAPRWRTYARVMGWPETDDLAIIDRLYKDFAERGTPQTVKNRAWTYSAITAGGANVGTGTVVRLTEDGYQYKLESQLVAEDKRVEVIQDEHSGAQRHREILAVRGEPFGVDVLDITGTGIYASLRALSIDDSASYLQNPGFEQVNISSGVSLTSLPGWTVGDLTKVETNTTSTYIYQDVPGQTARSLRFTGNTTIQQDFETQRIAWPRGLPLFCQVPYYPRDAFDGTLTLTIGGKTAAVAAPASGAWGLLRFPLTYDAWFRRWNTTGAVWKLEVTGRSAGSIYVDSIALSPFANIGGVFYAAVGGATPFLVDDYFTFSDTCSETGIIQKWMARTYGRYFPHTSGSPVWAEP